MSQSEDLHFTRDEYAEAGTHVARAISGGFIATTIAFIVAVFGYSATKALDTTLVDALLLFSVALPPSALSGYLALAHAVGRFNLALLGISFFAIQTGIFLVLWNINRIEGYAFEIAMGLCVLALSYITRLEITRAKDIQRRYEKSKSRQAP